MIPENPNQVDSPILLGSRIMSSFIVSYRKYTWSLSGDGIQSRLDCTPTPLTSFCTLVFSPVKCESTLSFHCCPKPDDGASLPPWMNECIKWMNTRESEHWSSGHGGSKWLSQSSAHFGGGPRTRGWLSGIWSDVGKKCSLLVWGIIPFSENVLLSNSWNDPILYHLYTEKLNLLSVAGPGAQLVAVQWHLGDHCCFLEPSGQGIRCRWNRKRDRVRSGPHTKDYPKEEDGSHPRSSWG